MFVFGNKFSLEDGGRGVSGRGVEERTDWCGGVVYIAIEEVKNDSVWSRKLFGVLRGEGLGTMLGPCCFVDVGAWSSNKKTMVEFFASAGGSIAN
jgi:hypothetical protein